MKQFLFLRRGLAVLLASAVLITGAVLTSAEPELPPSDQENSEFLSSNDQPSSEVDNSSSDITTDVPPESGTVQSGEDSSMEDPASSDSSDAESTDSIVTSEDSSALTSSVSSASPPSSRTSSRAPSTRPQQPTPTISPEWNDDLDRIYNNACDWLRQRQDGELFFIAMGGAGRSIDSRQYGAFLSTVSDNTYTELYPLALAAINATFCGVQATNVNGTDLITQLVSFPDIESCDAKALAYALLALDSNPYDVPQDAKNSREDFITALLNQQNEDGRFETQTSDSISTTAICLSALSTYVNDSKVRTAVNNGVSYLQAEFKSTKFKSESSIVLSRVIAGLTCLNININDSRFANGSQNLCDLLQNHLSSDGGFKKMSNDAASDALSTESAIIALTAIKYFTSPYVIRQSLPESVSSTSRFNGIKESGWYWWLLCSSGVVIAGGLAVGIPIYLKKKKKSSETE